MSIILVKVVLLNATKQLLNEFKHRKWHSEDIEELEKNVEYFKPITKCCIYSKKLKKNGEGTRHASNYIKRLV